MDFEFTDDQHRCATPCASWVDKGFAFERRHGIAKQGGRARDVYGELADLGLTGLAVHEVARRHGLRPPSRRWW